MRRQIPMFISLICCSSCLILPTAAANTIDAAEPMEAGRNYSYTYFTRIDENEDDWFLEDNHLYSFSPLTTDEYTVEVKGNWINENTCIEVKSQSGMYIDFGDYNPYLDRVTATAKLNAGQKYFIEVNAGGESSVTQVLTTSVSRHNHEYETKDYEKCEIKSYNDGYLEAYDGCCTKWCRVCDYEEYKTILSPSRLRVSPSKMTYNGKIQKPKVSLAYDDGKAFTSCKIQYTNSKEPGRYKVTITFTGDYTGTISVPYSIVPAKAGTPKLKAIKGGFDASWKAVSKADEYQIQWSIDKTFFFIDGKKNIKKTSYKVKNEYPKNYPVYVRIRACKTDDGKKVYGGWSNVKSVKVR